MQYTAIMAPFNELTVKQLYQALKLRSDVFVVEQNCVYPELDDKDCHHQARHVLLYQHNSTTLMAYARCLPPNLSYAGSSIGRVVVANEFRGTGIAQALMQKAIAACLELWPTQAIEIGAQFHLLGFYESFGFVATSDPYDEDGIMHIDMKRETCSKTD